MRGREERASDFEQRSASGDEVFSFADAKYIPVNPFLGDVALLTSIGTPSSQCAKADAYWSVLEDVAFVQVTSVSPKWLPVGCYRRWGRNGLNLVSVVSERTVSRATYEVGQRQMRCFVMAASPGLVFVSANAMAADTQLETLDHGALERQQLLAKLVTGSPGLRYEIHIVEPDEPELEMSAGTVQFGLRIAGGLVLRDGYSFRAADRSDHEACLPLQDG